MLKTQVFDNNLNAVIDKDISDSKEDVFELIQIQYEFFNGDFNKLIIQFADCKFINAAVAVLIGTLPVYLLKSNRRVKLE